MNFRMRRIKRITLLIYSSLLKHPIEFYYAIISYDIGLCFLSLFAKEFNCFLRISLNAKEKGVYKNQEKFHNEFLLIVGKHETSCVFLN